MEFQGPWIGPLSLKGFAAGLVFSMIGASPARGSLPPVVRILVEPAAKPAIVGGFDISVDHYASHEKVLHADGPARLEFHCRSVNGSVNGIAKNNIIIRYMSGRAPSTIPLKVKESNGPVRVSSMGGFLRVDGKRFRDELFIYPQNGKCEVVNHVDLEKYVAGLLNSEMSARWNLETLKAQAIAARTYALYQMEVASKDGKSFDMHATVKDQVYEGAHQERYRTIRAVQETRGQILTHGGKTIKAFYHSTCGGHTTTPERVWGVRAKYLTPVRCEFCHTSPRYRWAYRVGHSVLEMAFRMKGLVQKKLTDLKITQKSPSGRVLQVAYADGTERRTINGDRLREVVGYSNLRSTSFDVLKTGNTYVFDGGGAGHGVGLCQWGAKTMGDRGYKATAILKKYYPLAQVTKVY